VVTSAAYLPEVYETPALQQEMTCNFLSDFGASYGHLQFVAELFAMVRKVPNYKKPGILKVNLFLHNVEDSRKGVAVVATKEDM
jgi:hypothetical protein